MMPFDKKKIFEQAKKAISANNLVFMQEVPDYLPCGRSTFYEFFPDGSEEMDIIKTLIGKNKTSQKVAMRQKWYESEAPALQLALYKLIATPDEHRALQMVYNDHTTNGKDVAPPITWSDETTE